MGNDDSPPTAVPRRWVASLLVGVLPLVVTLFLVSAVAVAAEPVPLVEHDGSRGVWVRTDAVEAFVATEPRFRVLAVRRPGAASLLADATREQQGVRLAFMEPIQVPKSFDVGEQPAVVLELAPAAARVRLAPAAGLRYDVAVELDDKSPRVRLKLDLTNVGEASRRVACWSVLSFPRDEGTVVVPFGLKPRALRKIVLSWWTRWPQPGVRFGRDAMAVDVAVPLDGNAMKVGVATDAGWGAYVRGTDGLVASAPVEPDGQYPEGGANLTYFAAGWCEIEHVGPLRTVGPGQSTRLEQTLDLITLPSNLPPDPDAARAAVEKQHPTK